jgi:hypothetical protein
MKPFRWLASTGAFWWVAWLGLHGSGFAWNAWRFVCVMALVISVAHFFVNADEKVKGAERSRRLLPAWLILWIGFSGACLLAGYGHYVFALCAFAESVFDCLAHEVQAA